MSSDGKVGEVTSEGRRDTLYTFDEAKLESVRQGKAWAQDPKYFKRVSVSPSAAMKMMMHGQSGVDKGTSTSGKPLEVMGLLLGRPDTDDVHNIIITDAQPLPVEGFETKVIADDQNVINYMIDLSESLALTRKERFCGWYHTHPFDVGVHSNCFMSNTDISTQLMWQLNEDNHGNPWVAIVIDPLRSLAKSRPEMIAFRAYPPDYSARADETPDGKIVRDDKTRLELWGACWARYYALEVKYYMSELASNTLSILRNNSMWQNSFSSSAAMREEHTEEAIESLGVAIENLEKYEPVSRKMKSFSESSSGHDMSRRDHLVKAVETQVALSLDKCQESLSELAKVRIFGGPTSVSSISRSPSGLKQDVTDNSAMEVL